jgi:hypothetical protein
MNQGWRKSCWIFREKELAFEDFVRFRHDLPLSNNEIGRESVAE